MRAAKGDRLHFEGRAVGMHEHTAVVLECRGADGAPPYLVRHADAHEAVVFPGPDAWVEQEIRRPQPMEDDRPPDQVIVPHAPRRTYWSLPRSNRGGHPSVRGYQ